MQGLPEIGDVLDGTYKIESLLGTGGFGAVYLARQLSMDRQVALKILVANAMNVEEMIQRFRREVMACRNLGHPNTIRIYDFRDRPDGILYYTMEYVNGPTLKDVIKAEGALPPERVAHILKQICKSLAEAHSFGIVHRDLKPANIMLADIAGEDDFVKVVDFGIAKIVDDGNEERDQLTNAGVLVGTLNYMSPEQIQGGEIGPASDLYALGLIALEMLMGHSVFEGTGRWEVLHKQISDEPVDIPTAIRESSLGQVLEKSLKKRSTERFDTATAMLTSLSRVKNLEEDPLVEADELAATAVVSADLVARATSGARDFSLPESVPVESEPPLPEPVREPPMRTKSLEETTSPGDSKPAVEASAPTSVPAFFEEPTSMVDSGISANPLQQQRPVQHTPSGQFGPMPIQTPAPRPAISPPPTGSRESVDVPSGDTDVGPAPSNNKGLMAIAAGVILLVVVAVVVLTQMGGSDDPAAEPDPSTEPIATKTPTDPADPLPIGEIQPIERETPPPDDTAAVTKKEVRLLTPGVKAQVFDGAELLGETPLRFEVGDKKTFTLRADGYEEQEIALSNASDDVVDIRLERVSVASNKTPTEKTPTEKKPTEKKPTEKKPTEKKPDKPSGDDGWVDVKKKKPDVPVF